jgi:hypothetical protein
VFNTKFKVLQQVKKEIQNTTPSTAGVQQQNSKYGWCSKKIQSSITPSSTKNSKYNTKCGWCCTLKLSAKTIIKNGAFSVKPTL